jgi:hypothetical protein
MHLSQNMWPVSLYKLCYRRRMFVKMISEILSRYFRNTHRKARRTSCKVAVNIFQSILKLTYLDNFNNIHEFDENVFSCSWVSACEYTDTGAELRTSRDVQQRREGAYKDKHTVLRRVILNSTASASSTYRLLCKLGNTRPECRTKYQQTAR